MPRIIVTTETDPAGDRTVLLEERVAPADLESDHFSAQLVERLGWALADAREVEQPAAPSR